jgi:hypothetical protein
MDYVLIMATYYAIASAEFYTKAACEDAGKAFMLTAAKVHMDGSYTCTPKAQNRPQHEQYRRPL